MAASSLSRPATPAALRHGACHGLGLALALPRSLPPSAATRCAALRRDASGGRDQYGGALVDEGMPVLRRRIREAWMVETNYEAPAEWAPWEKRYYPAYVSDVSSLVGALQLLLMGTRPGVAIAVAALVLASVPVSTVAALVLASVPVSTVAALHHLAMVAEAVLQSVHHIS